MTHDTIQKRTSIDAEWLRNEIKSLAEGVHYLLARQVLENKMDVTKRAEINGIMEIILNNLCKDIGKHLGKEFKVLIHEWCDSGYINYYLGETYDDEEGEE